MKKLLAAALFFAAFIASLPFINGIVMEKAVNDVFTNINSMYQDSGTGYSLQIIRYDRGFYSTDIEWKISLGKLQPLYGIDEIIFSDHARHGVTEVVSTTNLNKNEWFNSFVSKNLQGHNPISMVTRYSLLGKIDSKCSIEAFSFTAEGKDITVNPGTVTVSTDHELKNFISAGNWLGFSIDDSLMFGGMTHSAELEMVSTFLWNGNASFDAARITVREGNHDIDINNISGSYLLDLDMDRNSYSIGTSLAIDSIAAATGTMKDINGRIAINNMNPSGYEEFMKQYMEIIAAAVSSVAELEEGAQQSKEMLEQQLTAAGLQLIAAYEKMLKKNLEIKISDVHAALPQGIIKADITLRLLKDMTLMRFAPIMGQPDLLLDIFYIKSDISLPAELTGDTPVLFDPPYQGMKTGIFVKDGDILTHSAETRDKQLTVNGQVVDLTR